MGKAKPHPHDGAMPRDAIERRIVKDNEKLDKDDKARRAKVTKEGVGPVKGA